MDCQNELWVCERCKETNLEDAGTDYCWFCGYQTEEEDVI